MESSWYLSVDMYWMHTVPLKGNQFDTISGCQGGSLLQVEPEVDLVKLGRK